MYLEGNTKEDALVAIDPAGRPSWFNNQFYFFMTLLCMGWIIRLYMYVNTVNVNYYLKKLIIKWLFIIITIWKLFNLFNQRCLMFLLACNGTSLSKPPHNFLRKGFLAAHYFMSSPQGNVRIVTAKNSKKSNLTRVVQVHKIWISAVLKSREGELDWFIF